MEHRKIIADTKYQNVTTTVKLKGKDAESILRLMERLEEHDDVQNVFANFDIEDDEMDRIMS